jgi:putative ABC transport system permease protein
MPAEYTVLHTTQVGRAGSINFPLSPPPLALAIKQKFPGIEQLVNIDPEGGGVIKFNNKVIRQNDICFADSAFFKIFDYTFLSGDAANALIQPQAVVITESLAKENFW